MKASFEKGTNRVVSPTRVNRYSLPLIAMVFMFAHTRYSWPPARGVVCRTLKTGGTCTLKLIYAVARLLSAPDSAAQGKVKDSRNMVAVSPLTSAPLLELI